MGFHLLYLYVVVVIWLSQSERGIEDSPLATDKRVTPIWGEEVGREGREARQCHI